MTNHPTPATGATGRGRHETGCLATVAGAFGVVFVIVAVIVAALAG